HVCNAGIIAGATPHESAVHASRCDLLLPDDHALAIGIGSIDCPALVTGNQNPLSAADRLENARTAEIMINDGILRTICFVGSGTSEIPLVVRRELTRPEQSS